MITSTKVVLGIVVSITRNECSKCAFEVLYLSIFVLDLVNSAVVGNWSKARQ